MLTAGGRSHVIIPPRAPWDATGFEAGVLGRPTCQRQLGGTVDVPFLCRSNRTACGGSDLLACIPTCISPRQHPASGSTRRASSQLSHGLAGVPSAERWHLPLPSPPQHPRDPSRARGELAPWTFTRLREANTLALTPSHRDCKQQPLRVVTAGRAVRERGVVWCASGGTVEVTPRRSGMGATA